MPFRPYSGIVQIQPASLAVAGVHGRVPSPVTSVGARSAAARSLGRGAPGETKGPPRAPLVRGAREAGAVDEQVAVDGAVLAGHDVVDPAALVQLTVDDVVDDPPDPLPRSQLHQVVREQRRVEVVRVRELRVLLRQRAPAARLLT